MVQQMLIRWRAEKAARSAKSGSEVEQEDNKPAAKRGRMASAKNPDAKKGRRRTSVKSGTAVEQEGRKPDAKSVSVDYFKVNPYQQLMGMVSKSAKQQHKRKQKERRAAIAGLDVQFFGQKQK